MRVYDAAIHNRIANDPKVVRNLEWDPARGPLTFDNLAPHPDAYALLVNPSHELAMIFEWSAPGVWQVHTMALPSIWGRGVGEAKTLIHEMFVEYDADMIWGQTPLHNMAARKFNAKIGALPCGFGHHHVAGDVEYFRNSRARWLREHWPA